jgi:hypothetical protein
VTLKDARTIITDRLARDSAAARFRPQPPPARHVRDFLTTYATQPVRLVQTTRPAPWLDGKSRGWVVSSLGPAEVFELTEKANIDTPDGPFEVTPLGPVLPLAMLDPLQAQLAARGVLDRLAHADLYNSWLRNEEAKQLAGAICLGDNMPTPGPTDLAAFAPFLIPG